MEHPALWKLLIEAWSALTHHFESMVEQHCLEHGLDLRSWALMLAVKTIEPEETTPSHLLIRVPYMASEVYKQRLDVVREKGYLTMNEPGGYRLTRNGQELTNHLIQVARDEMTRVDPLLPAESQRLADVMGRLVECSLMHPAPPDTWAIRLSCKLMPGKLPPMPFIEQSMTAMAAYRDDAHLAAWKNTGLSATALEVLTNIWRGDVTSLDDVCYKLASRGHSCSVYKDAIRDLRNRGYVSGSDDDLIMTASGRFYRGQVEEYTDLYFYRPWDCLSPDERIDMSGALRKMVERL